MTRAELAELVAQELRWLAAGEALTPEDLAAIQSRIDGKRAWLIEENLCYWDAESIPAAVSLPLAKIVAHECRNVFGVNYDAGAEGLRELRMHCARRASGEPLATNFF